ncbi:Oidioi.mRNA.OKI2018_I69.chr2.g7758.t1.cds [Oikopleura dioica]|uniref:Oidioi.mRNA.OKI2018_I69.chr2.g7758.t1.cds n=1 Tax=Oikopleura dioica TaxID=34765 RepID=A0ABN7TDM6_OIKDI|nr:Oidioi.mRNA.OKI2018_I69.chr2.g7758.t1.cds [Oikopleura dioica]
MKLSIALASAVFADTQCTSKGGTCTDYRYTTCYAGYERYICNGDSNRQCCLYCSPTCEAKEELDSAGDSRCTAAGGECKHNTNYCNGTYQSGLCGGGASRQCCTGKEDPDPPVDVGGDYFNRYYGYKLGGKISGEDFSSLSSAKNRCSTLGSSCSGVVNDYAGHYYLSTSYTFSSASGQTTYEKGEKWSARFVPRVEWEARSPTGVTNFQLPARHGLIGHHTAGSHCSDKASCISNMKGTQNYHMDSLGWSDIGYQFLIGEDGRIYEGRGQWRQGAHCSNWNSNTIGFSVMGNFSNRLPNQNALDAVDELIAWLERKNYVNKNCYEFAGHRDKNATVCPGDPLYAHWGSGKYPFWHRKC